MKSDTNEVSLSSNGQSDCISQRIPRKMQRTFKMQYTFYEGTLNLDFC